MAAAEAGSHLGLVLSVTVEILRNHRYSLEDVGEHPSRSCLLSL